MNLIKRISLLLAVCMLFSAICLLSSCQKDDTQLPATTESESIDTSATTEDVSESTQETTIDESSNIVYDTEDTSNEIDTETASEASSIDNTTDNTESVEETTVEETTVEETTVETTTVEETTVETTTVETTTVEETTVEETTVETTTVETTTVEETTVEETTVEETTVETTTVEETTVEETTVEETTVEKTTVEETTVETTTVEETTVEETTVEETTVEETTVEETTVETTTVEETTVETTTVEETTVEETTVEETTVEETSKKPEFTTLEDPSAIAREEMPRIDINTEGGVDITSKEVYVRATISVSRCEDKYIRTNLEGGIRARGNSTFGAPKKPYRIKFDKKQNLLGLNGEKHFKNWVLMADYFDASMLRTFATFKLAEVLLEGKYYSSDCTPVEVYLNGNPHGVYLLCEQTQINPGRVNIYEKDDDETSVEIGYLMIGQGGRTDEPESIVIPANITVTDRTGNKFDFGGLNFALSGSGYTEEQKAYVVKYVEGVFKVLRGALYEDKYYTLSRDGQLSIKTTFNSTTKAEKQIETINAVFNIESAVALCALDEIVKNLDAMTFNMYVDLSPKGDARLTLAAPWDFDFSMANTHYSTTHSYKGFYATNISYSEGMRTNLFYVMFGSIDWFDEMVCELWREKYPEMQQAVYDVLLYSYKYQDAYNRDWERWGSASGRITIYHHATADLATFTKHLDNGTLLYTWLTKRLEWLDRQWGDTEYPEGMTPDIVIDFTKEESINYTSGWQRCEGKITTVGLLVTTDNGYDPYFTVELESFDAIAEDYPYIEICMKVPINSSSSSYQSEIFLSSGTVTHATGGISVRYDIKAEGKFVTYRINLEETGFWTGDIHRIRIDYFPSCEPGDVIYIKSIKLTSK